MRNKNLRVKIIVAAHKKYQMPADSMYIPMHVGAEGKTDAKGNELDLGYVKDNTGVNISNLNSNFCELTGLYWAWKNLDADYIGLVHYRRYFSCSKKSKNFFENIITYEELVPLLEQYEIIVPKKRRYYIESLYSHYKHTHYVEQLDKTKEIIAEKYPEYLSSYNRVLKRSYGYMFNMMIMSRELMDDYCSWLFVILFELKENLNMPEVSYFQGRFYGRISELIFNVWLDYQVACKKINKQKIKEVSCVHMEKINWWKKGTAFLQAKFFCRKYDASF